MGRVLKESLMLKITVTGKGAPGRFLPLPRLRLNAGLPGVTCTRTHAYAHTRMHTHSRARTRTHARTRLVSDLRVLALRSVCNALTTFLHTTDWRLRLDIVASTPSWADAHTPPGFAARHRFLAYYTEL